MHTVKGVIVKTPKLLIVEDEIIFAWHLIGLIEDLGYQVYKVVASGEAGLKAVGDDPPDLIFMGISLKGELGGAETVNQIRLHADIPIVFFTSCSDEQLLGWMKQLHKNIVLINPLDACKLRSAINTILANSFLTEAWRNLDPLEL